MCVQIGKDKETVLDQLSAKTVLLAMTLAVTLQPAQAAVSFFFGVQQLHVRRSRTITESSGDPDLFIGIPKEDVESITDTFFEVCFYLFWGR